MIGLVKSSMGEIPPSLLEGKMERFFLLTEPDARRQQEPAGAETEVIDGL